MAKRRRVLVTLESRATFGYSVNVIKRAMADPALEVQTLLTGMHLMPELGNSQSMLHRAQIPISATVPLTPGAGRAGWPRAMGHAISGFAEAYDRLDPEIVLISGDRYETFALAVAAVYMGIPVAHIQAGDKSGHIDDAARMALAKLVHIHLASGADAVERLRRLGEQEFRIFDTGAPQLDDMVGRSFKQARITLDGKDFDLTEPYVVLIQHPVMHQHDRIVEQIEATLHACFATGLGIVWIYPNSDFGFRDILAIIERQRSHDRIVAVPNLDREDYLTVLANAACLVGNSSSGLLEAPTFRIPVVNIGNRQRGRPQALNIVNTSYDPADIERAIRFVLTDAKFRDDCSRAVNPFGDGKSAERIVGILRDIRIDEALLDKQTTY
jgi:UDP-N-acetylglucosamine 2-epimerase (non-hydrolysing)/GDP/UDP-N,N'-diacetylbacillosamine 2-epimerase (hydrolysing)